MDNSNSDFIAHLGSGGLKTVRIKNLISHGKDHYQEHRNDEAKETNGAPEYFHNEYLDKECRVGSIRKSSSRSNLGKD